MGNNEIVGIVKESPKILLAIYNDLAHPAVKKVGKALETVFEFSTSFLLPLKLLNEKFKLNFQKRLNAYKEKIEDISDDDICKVDPQIGTPIIERLSYTTNDEIAELFINLLAKATSQNTLKFAHPSFVHLIERLSVDEARIIKYLNDKAEILTISVKAQMAVGFNYILKDVTILPYEIEFLFPENIQTYLDNLIGMGILNFSHGLKKADELGYNYIFHLYNYEELKAELTGDTGYDSITKDTSFYLITDFGKAFIHACNSGS